MNRFSEKAQETTGLQDARNQIRQELVANPELSNRALSERYGIRDKAVAAIRHELEQAKRIPAVQYTIGKDGRRRKLRRRGTVSTGKAQLQAKPSPRPSAPSRSEKPLFQWYTAQRRSPAKATAPRSVLGQVRTAFSGHRWRSWSAWSSAASSRQPPGP